MISILCKNPIKQCVCKKDFVWNPITCASEIGIHLKDYVHIKIFSDDSLITCDENIDTTDTVSINSMKKKMQNVTSIVLLYISFFLLTMFL